MKDDFVIDDSWELLLSLCLRNNIPFYVYRLPESDKIICGIQTDAHPLEVKSLQQVKGKQGFLMSPFDVKGPHSLWFIRGDIFIEDERDIAALMPRLEKLKFPEKSTHEQVVVSDHHDYMRQINNLLSDLRSGKARKAILSRIHTLEGIGRSKAPQMLVEMSKCYGHAFLFLVNVPGHTTWVGASPETLLKVNEQSVFTMALAGTQAGDDRSEQQVTWQQKEIEEQGIVSEYIESVLEHFDLHNVKKNGPFTVRAGNVFHLNTEYEILDNLPQDIIEKLIEQLHPTPAVCGLPKDKAKEIILSLEPHDREYYAGYLGPVSADGCCSLFVNLRSMKIMNDKIALYVGGGITADSIPEKEWQETCLKAQTMLSVVERVKEEKINLEKE